MVILSYINEKYDTKITTIYNKWNTNDKYKYKAGSPEGGGATVGNRNIVTNNIKPSHTFKTIVKKC